MQCHIVWCAVSVCVCDVMNGTDCHGDLANGINNGQVNDGSAREKKYQNALEFLITVYVVSLKAPLGY